MKIDTLIGILDIGSNSVMLTVARADLINPEVVFEFCRVTSLGEHSESTGCLQPAAIERTEKAIIEFTEKARSIGVKYFTGTATSAVRDARNGQEFVQRIIDKVGYEPLILSGEQEAELVFLGSTFDLDVGQKVITCDPGGGSTEINIGVVGEKPQWAFSFNIGCVRQGNKFDLCGDVLEQENIISARKNIAEIMSPAFSVCDGLDEYDLYISAGTATTYIALASDMQVYDRQAIHHQKANLTELDKCVEKLSDMSLADRQQIPAIGNRAATIPTGLLIMSEALQGFHKETFTVTTTALRYGMVLEFSKKVLAVN